MKTYPHLIVCEHCDHVYRRVALRRGQVARCEVCAAVLYRAQRLSVEQWLALTVAAAITFVLANVCPVMQIGMSGLHNEATLWQAVLALARGQAGPIALPAAAAVMGVPGLQIVLLGWVLGFACAGRQAPAFALALRALALLRPWSMMEVCLLGALVAIVKLSSYVTVVPGVGIWAIAALTLFLPLIASRDTHWLWAHAGAWPP